MTTEIECPLPVEKRDSIESKEICFNCPRWKHHLDCPDIKDDDDPKMIAHREAQRKLRNKQKQAEIAAYAYKLAVQQSNRNGRRTGD